MNYHTIEDEIIQDTSIHYIKQLLLDSNPNSTIFLVGSYASNTAHKNSDLDFLVIVDQNQLLDTVKKVKKHFFSLDKSIRNKLDCKIISKNDINEYRNTQYLMLYSMIENGELLHGREIKIKLDIDKLSHEVEKFIDQIQEISNWFDLNYHKNYIGTWIFSLSKSLNYLERIINKKSYQTLKEIWGENLSFIGKLYEKTQRKGISTSFTLKMSFKIQKNTNYDRLMQCYNQLTEYSLKVKKKFDIFYKLENKF